MNFDHDIIGKRNLTGETVRVNETQIDGFQYEP